MRAPERCWRRCADASRRASAGEDAHPIEYGMNLRHNVSAVGDDRDVSRRPRRNMQHGAALGNVDLLAAEHRVDALAQPRLLRKLDEQLYGFVGDAILGVVGIDADGHAREAFAASRIVREELRR